MSSINVLSLFDGISCGQLALRRAGIDVNNYFASEIDKNAIKVTQHNFPNTIQLGDVVNVTGDDLPKIDLIMGGSPCQGFSFSANRAQSKMEYGRITGASQEHLNKEFLSDAGKITFTRVMCHNYQLGPNGFPVDKAPPRLNLDDPRSKLFFELVRLVKKLKPKYFLLENVKMKQVFQDVISDQLGVKPIEVDSRYFSAQSRRRLYWTNIPFEYDKDWEEQKEKAGEGIFLKNIMSPYYGDRMMSDEEVRQKLIPHLESSKYRANGLWAAANNKSFLWRRDTEGRVLVMRPDKLKIQRIGRIGEGRHKSEIITVSSHPHVFDGKDIRKVNPLEAERLQTVPDDYTNVEGMTPGMRYKMLGNGWTVDTIVNIFKGIKKNGN